METRSWPYKHFVKQTSMKTPYTTHKTSCTELDHSCVQPLLPLLRTVRNVGSMGYPCIVVHDEFYVFWYWPFVILLSAVFCFRMYEVNFHIGCSWERDERHRFLTAYKLCVLAASLFKKKIAIFLASCTLI